MTMRMLGTLGLTAAVLLAGCDNSTDATAEVGELRTAIIAGGVQTTIAGAPRLPNSVIAQAQRIPPGGSVAASGSLMANVTAAVHGLPNVVQCVAEDQFDLIPFSRCVNTDTAGNALFTFSPTTKAGTYRAKINFTLGTTESTVDSVVVVVKPDAADPNYQSGALPIVCSPAELPASVVRDKYGNSVPFRVVPDGRFTVQGDTVGTLAARTVVFDSTLVTQTRFTADLKDGNGSIIGRLRYRFVSAGCVGKAVTDWFVVGANITPTP